MFKPIDIEISSDKTPNKDNRYYPDCFPKSSPQLALSPLLLRERFDLNLSIYQKNVHTATQKAPILIKNQEFYLLSIFENNPDGLKFNNSRNLCRH